MKSPNKKNPALEMLIRTARIIVNYSKDKSEVAVGRRWLRRFEKAKASAKS